MNIWRRVACSISKATRTHALANTHTHKYKTYYFLQQQWFRERASVLRYTYIDFFVCVNFAYSDSEICLDCLLVLCTRRCSFFVM